MNRKALIAIVVGVVLLAGIAAFLLWPKPEAAPQYVPPAHDALAVDASGFDPNLPTLNAGEYRVALNPDLQVNADGSCQLWFSNPEGNPCQLMLDVRLADSELLIYRTGLVAPGEGIETITFVPDALAAMAKGAQQAQLTVHSFGLNDYVNLGDVSLNTQLTLN